MNKFKKSSKRNKLFLIVVLAVIVFVQCHWLFENEVYNPNEHPVLNTGDTLVFEGENTVDSLYVRESKVYKPYEYTSTYGKEKYFCHIIRLNCVKEDTCLSLEISINEAFYNIISWAPFRDYLDPIGDVKSLEFEKRKNALNIGFYELTELYFIEFDSQVDLFKEIKSVLYSRAYGLVQYTNFKDEVYTLSEESLEMLMVRE